MATLHGTIADRQWYDAKSDNEIAHHIAGQSLREADTAIRDLNRAFRAAAGLNYALDPVNMVAINPVGELLDKSYKAASGARPPLTAAEIEPVVAWIRANSSPRT